MGTYLQRTNSSAGNRTTFTFSTWLKRSTLTAANQTIFYSQDDAQNYIRLYFDSNERLQLRVYIVNNLNSQLETNQVFRDPAAWYHIVWRCDTGNATAGDRNRLYLNGSEITSLATETTPDQSTTYPINNSSTLNEIGNEAYAQAEQFQGYMARTILADGQSYAPTEFGETDSTTGIWKPKSFSGTYGTNGFKLDFKNSGALGTDTSGNTNNFTVTNAGTNAQVVDTPTNNFAMMNSLANKYPNSTFTLGSLAVAMGASQSTFNTGTFGVSSGKWYFEMKPTAMGSGTDNCLVGVVSRSDSTGTSDYLGESTSVIYRNNGNSKKDGSNATYGASWTTSNIVMVAVDCDNNNIYFGTDGQWADGSGNNDEANPTGSIAFTSTMISDGVVFPAFGDLSTNSPEPAGQFNFGNPPFTISSGNSDANGLGNFEYAVPSGYYALCTENLNTYG